MYSSIMKTRTRPGDWIVLPGAGGGLGHMFVALAEMCEVYYADNFPGGFKLQSRKD